jgi:hypothetical protein
VPELNTPPEPASASFPLRLFWMLFGHAIVFLSLGIILVDKLAFPSILDGVIWINVVLMIVARRIDIVRYQGTTAIGELATLTHWRSYALNVIWVTAVASAIAHTLGR